MANKQLLDYVQKSVEAGFAVEQISNALLAQGWTAEDISEAFRINQEMMQRRAMPIPTPPPAPKRSEWDIEIKHLSASQVLLYLGALIVILAAIIYVSINWSVWNAAGRILAILLPTVICYVAGAGLFFKERHKKQGTVFLIVGALLFPAFLTVTFNELNVFDGSSAYYFGLAVSALSLIVYLASSMFFRFPGWAFLYLIAGLFTYYFGLESLQINDAWEVEAMLWLFLIPGTLYMIIGALLNKRDDNQAAHYAYVIGALTVGIVSIMLFSIEERSTGYALLILGLLYFVCGVFLERKGNPNAFGPYLIGTLVGFFSLFRVMASGIWLEDIMGEDFGYDQHIIGWSNVMLGVIYLGIGWFLHELKHFGLEAGSKASVLFMWIGPLWVLGGLHFLGLNGNHFILETLLLLASLAAIFISVPTKAKQFLFSGTIYLVIYIFSIGGEYFQNEVGWPITLFVAGLLSMGIGVITERLRRKYFVAKLS